MGPSTSTEELGPGDLNRTLLLRQGLLARTTGDPLAMVRHLVGLQAQDRMPPYLSLAARLADVDPRTVSRALASRDLVRLVCLRGTVHLLTPDDALSIRSFTDPVQQREFKASQTIAPARHLTREEVRRAADAVLADGPLAFKELGEQLAGRHFPGVPATALAQVARVSVPLAQLPPRGRWKLPGGVVVQRVDTWLGQPLADPDVPALIRRYLAAFGPATAADVTAWSGVTGLGPLLEELDLVTHRSGGTVLYDVPDAPLASSDSPAPVRLLGAYDNVWLSHAKRDRVTRPGDRRRWMGTNGGVASTVFVDGWLAGLWRVEEGEPVVVELFRELTGAQRVELDEELERVRALLAVPADE